MAKSEDTMTQAEREIFQDRLDAAEAAIKRGDTDAALTHLSDNMREQPWLWQR